MTYEKVSQPVVEDRVKSLQFILEREQNRTVSYAEAKEISEDLIGLFEILAEEADE